VFPHPTLLHLRLHQDQYSTMRPVARPSYSGPYCSPEVQTDTVCMSRMLVADEAWIARRRSDGSGGGKKIVYVGYGSLVFLGSFMTADFIVGFNGARVV